MRVTGTCMSRIHFIGGEKGGVGKSVVARLLAQWFVDRSLPFAALDGERNHGALMRYYRQFTQPVDFAHADSADQIIDRALGAERRVLVDLPAQSASSLLDWLQGANVIEFAKEMGIGLTFWHVSDGGYASVAEIERALGWFEERLEHVVVKNFGRSKDFTQFDDSEAKRNLERLSGRLIEIPELDSTVMYKIDRLGLSFWAASRQEAEPLAMKPLDRQRVRLWLDRCYAQFAALGDAV